MKKWDRLLTGAAIILAFGAGFATGAGRPILGTLAVLAGLAGTYIAVKYE
ncbi:hypothetical protein N9980_01315 [bacterium]|nr:hypothetical protein [bacterium]